MSDQRPPEYNKWKPHLLVGLDGDRLGHCTRQFLRRRVIFHQALEQADRPETWIWVRQLVVS